MNEQTKKLLILVAGALYFNFLFWKQSLGINLPLFTLILIPVMLSVNGGKRFKLNLMLSLILALFTALQVVWINNFLSIFLHFVSWFLVAGYVFQPSLRLPELAVLTSWLNHLKLKPALLPLFRLLPKNEKRTRRSYSFVRLSILPLIVFFVFLFIYKKAVPTFDIFLGDMFSSISDFFDWIFRGISMDHILFVLFGIFLINGLVFNYRIKFLAETDASLSEDLTRKRSRPFAGFLRDYRFQNKITLLLKKEYLGGLILLFLVNMLLLMVNIIDISTIWFDFEYTQGFNLSQFVHEGTYLLILSILLSMTIILYLFRGNLNYYPKNKWILLLAYLWMIQNMILLISVGIRNYHYIAHFDLTYKRIGVYVFLAATFIGLFSMLYKIAFRKTFFFLMKFNSWSVIWILVLTASFNWDAVIAKHNLDHSGPRPIDRFYLMRLSDKSLPVLYENRDMLNVHQLEQLDYRIDQFVNKELEQDWQGWNYADYIVLQKLKLLDAF